MEIDKKQVQTALYIAGAIAVLIVLFYFGKAVKNFLGISSSEEQAKADADKLAQLQKENSDQQKKLAAKGIVRKLTAQQAQSIADTVYHALNTSSVTKNRSLAYTQLMKILNDADFLAVSNAFGYRQDHTAFIPFGDKKNLLQFVADNLNEDYIDAINTAYRKSKMQYQF